MERIIAACGNDCAACPRYAAHPYEKTADQLRHTAELWLRIGYRDRLVSSEGIACMGCKPENECRYHVALCCAERGLAACGLCEAYPCERIKACFSVTKSFEPACKSVCTDEEYQQLRKAFFEKETNLNELKRLTKEERKMTARDSIHPDPKAQPQKEQEWADQIPDEEEEMDASEPTYRDGSVQHECWTEDGYTSDS